MSDSDTVAEPVMKHKYLALSIYYANLFKDFWAGPSAVFQAGKDRIYINSTLAVLCKPQRLMTNPVLAFGAFAEPPGTQRGPSYLPLGTMANNSREGV